MKSADLKLFDQRTIKRNIESGLVGDDEYRKLLKSLPDEAENAEEVPFEPEEREAVKPPPAIHSVSSVDSTDNVYPETKADDSE